MSLLTRKRKEIRWVYSTYFRVSDTTGVIALAFGHGLGQASLSQSSGRRKEYNSESLCEHCSSKL
jgi:hypothetical protein